MASAKSYQEATPALVKCRTPRAPPCARRHSARREVRRRRRSPDLVGDHAHLVPRRHQPQHGLQEVRARRTIDPGRSDDEGVGVLLEQGLLAGALGGPVDSQRGGGRVRRVGPPGRAVEHEVRGDVDEARADLRGRRGQGSGAVAICGKGRLRLLFGAIHGGVGGRVEDDVGAQLAHAVRHGGDIGDVQFRARERRNLRAGRSGISQLMAELTARAGDQYPHDTPPPRHVEVKRGV